MNRSCGACLVSSLFFGICLAQSSVPISQPIAANDPIARDFEKLIAELMASQGIPAIAAAITDAGGTLWARGFGITDYARRLPVTPETTFSIQSISKTFTATAVIIASHEGLVNLDTPITRYLPDFTVQSAFETRPVEKMTLRHLLSHTAGFTHEAPVGNNFDLEPGTFEEHVRSISDTWLRFPVGRHYAYSNLGIDLAAHIVERRSGVPFPEYVRAKLFEPLGMSRSSFDPARIVAEPNRAWGHDGTHSRVPVRVPMLAAGGMYSTAENLARYVRLQLNKGRVGDHQVLGEDGIAEMQSPPFFFTQTQGYGLGLARLERSGPPVYGHSGGGFGFLSDMYWYPDLGVGGVVLTNSTEHGLLQNLVFRLLDRLLTDERFPFHEKAQALKEAARDRNKGVREDPQSDLVNQNRVRLAAIQPRPGSDVRSRWSRHEGTYGFRVWGKPAGARVVRVGAEGLTLDGNALFEIQPGLFLTAGGETLDFRGREPLWRNIRLYPAGLGLWEKVLLGIAILLFPVVAIAWFLTAALRRIRRQPDRGMGRGWLSRTALTVAGLNLISCIVVTVTVLNFPFLADGGWPDPTPVMALPLRLALLIPHAIVVLTGGMLVLAAWAARSRSCSSTAAKCYRLISIGSVLFVVLFVAWGTLGIIP